jgi:outer membrane protein assembly factor BamE (lipoprotein component of BamABCDE complex)
MPTRKNIITILIILTTIIAAITIAITISTPPPFSQKTINITNESKIAGFTLFEITPFAETPVPWNSTIIYYQNGTIQIININNPSQNWWMPIVNESKNRNFNYIQSLGNSTTYIPINPDNSIFTNGKHFDKASTNSKHPTVNTQTTYFNNTVILTEIIVRNPEQKSNAIAITDETKIAGFTLNENSITNAIFLPWYSAILYYPNGTLQIINIDTTFNKPSPELWETIINETQNRNYDAIKSLGNSTIYIPIPPEDSIFIYGRSIIECPNGAQIKHPTPDIITVSFNNETILTEIKIRETHQEKQEKQNQT